MNWPLQHPVLRVAVVGLAALCAVVLAIVTAFLAPTRIGEVPVPVAFPLVAAGAVGVVRLAHRGSGSLLATAVPALCWFMTMTVLAGRRPEGDLVVINTWPSLGLLVLGSLSFAVGIVLEVARRTHRQSSSVRRADDAEPVTGAARRGTM